jgi:hypothetical protein
VEGVLQCSRYGLKMNINKAGYQESNIKTNVKCFKYVN